MSLAVGARLGPYEVVALIGEGGMGKVWRARHTGLKRDDALKVLPDAFAADPDRLARFQREAQVLASLNHPHIAHVYGLEEASGIKALVMELVEGETLADRIARGPIPIDEALPIATQIAEALEAAHEQGIIHRDLKPANIKVRADGTVKVLDFGLAKLTENAPHKPDHSLSPTITSPAMMTGAGVLLGTAAYMSPEQARGKTIDKRSDIWAFGAVLYEMLTGRRAFAGEDVSDTLATVLKSDPDWTALPHEVPSSIRRLLRRCLAKDPWKRVGDISTALFVLEEPQDRADLQARSDTGIPSTRSERARSRGRRVALIAAATLLAGGVLGGAGIWLMTRAVPASVVRLTIAPVGSETLSIGGNDRDIAITPDGARVVYIGNNGTQLFVRPLDRLEATVLVTGGPRNIFMSPDGQWVGFSDGTTTLKKVAITGGPAVTIAPLDGLGPRGATWMPDNTIVFATNTPSVGLRRVPSGGGDATVLTRPDRGRGEIYHWWPEVLPGGREVLFTIMAAGGADAAQIAVIDLMTGVQKIVVRGGSHAHYLPTGHLVYAARGTLRAVGFDLDRLEARGTPVPVVPRLVTTPMGSADFDVAASGILAYVESTASLGARMLVWVDRSGREQPVPLPPRFYSYPRVSPDGSRIAVALGDQEQDIWLVDSARETLTRLTFDPSIDSYPVWSPDGRRIIFISQRSGANAVFWQSADGTGAAERLKESNYLPTPTGISPDGKQLVFAESGTNGIDVMSLTLTGNHDVRPLVQTSFNERNGIVSPDGRWLAYESDSSGQFEIYVRPFSNTASGHWQVSSAGGTRPLWARNGKELFYLGLDGALMRVPVEVTGTTWNARKPVKLLESRYFGTGSNPGRTYDISPDGQRFLMIKAAGADQASAPPHIVVVQNWFEELKRLVPAQ